MRRANQTGFPVRKETTSVQNVFLMKQEPWDSWLTASTRKYFFSRFVLVKLLVVRWFGMPNKAIVFEESLNNIDQSVLDIFR